MTQFAENVAAASEHELHRWNIGVGRASEQPYSSYIAEYWSVGLGIARRDGTTIYVDPGGRPFRPAWSAAFISYIFRTAGAGKHFLYNQAHIHYVAQALRDAQLCQSAYFLARDVSQYAPKVGDILVEIRGISAPSWMNLMARYGPKLPPEGNFIPMHSDIVVEIECCRTRLRTIGGNLGEGTVAERWWKLNADGTLEAMIQLLCIIENRL